MLHLPAVCHDLNGNDPGRLGNTTVSCVRHFRLEACHMTRNSYYRSETAIPAQWVPWLYDAVVGITNMRGIKACIPVSIGVL